MRRNPAMGNKRDSRLLVCEKTGVWAIALRRVLSSSGIRIYQIRSIAECWEELSKYPASFVALEHAPNNHAQIVEQLTRLPLCFPQSRVVVFSRRELRYYEWLLREAGAVEVLFSKRNLEPLSNMIIRYFSSLPERELSLTERLWESLPWAS